MLLDESDLVSFGWKFRVDIVFKTGWQRSSKNSIRQAVLKKARRSRLITGRRHFIRRDGNDTMWISCSPYESTTDAENALPTSIEDFYPGNRKEYKLVNSEDVVLQSSNARIPWSHRATYSTPSGLLTTNFVAFKVDRLLFVLVVSGRNAGIAWDEILEIVALQKKRADYLGFRSD